MIKVWHLTWLSFLCTLFSVPYAQRTRNRAYERKQNETKETGNVERWEEKNNAIFIREFAFADYQY